MWMFAVSSPGPGSGLAIFANGDCPAAIWRVGARACRREICASDPMSLLDFEMRTVCAVFCWGRKGQRGVWLSLYAAARIR